MKTIYSDKNKRGVSFLAKKNLNMEIAHWRISIGVRPVMFSFPVGSFSRPS